MRLLFLIPLIIGLAVGYIFKNSADEMAEIVSLVIVVSLILSLVIAPWQFQLLILVLVLVSTKRLLQQNQYRVKAEEEECDGSNKHPDNQ